MEKAVKFQELSEDDLKICCGGANPYGKNHNNVYDWELGTQVYMPIHGGCPAGVRNLGYIGGGNFLCKGDLYSF